MDKIDYKLINNKYNRQLLFRFLTKFYGSDKAKYLMLKHKDHLFDCGNLAYSLGKKSLEFFCLYFLQDTFVPRPDNQARKLAPVHYHIWNTLEDMMIQDSFDKLELILPRGSAKTTVADFALSVWSHVYGISKYSLIAGKTEQDSIEFIRDTRHALEENPFIIYTFGHLIDPKKFIVNRLELELTNETKIQAISSTSSMRGKKFRGSRPTIIIADDYQSKADVLTQEARDKKYSTFQQDSGFAGDKAVYRNNKKIKMATKFIVLGTILHKDCFMSRLMKDRSYKHILKRAINYSDVDELFNDGLWAEFKKLYFNSSDLDSVSTAKEFYYQHESDMQFSVLWPDKYNCMDLAIDYYSEPTSFKQEMQNDAEHIGEKVFHNMVTKSSVEIEKQKFTKTILCCDPAVETGRRNDYSAFIVGSKTTNNFRFVRKGIIDKLSFDDYIDKIISLLKIYPDIVAVWIEKNTYNGSDARELQKRIDKEFTKRQIEIINERQIKNKEAKIRAIAGKVDSGFIVFNEEDQDANQQLLDYQGEQYTQHDDFPDIVAEFNRLIDEIKVIQPIKFFNIQF
ncbi:MAG: phage terminase large subunit [Sporolactobacillus sp.]